MRRKLNAEQKRALVAGELRALIENYGRKAQKGVEPNDRRYDKELLKSIERMKPENLDRLLREDDEVENS